MKTEQVQAVTNEQESAKPEWFKSPERILRPENAWEMLGLCKSSFYALAQQDEAFPKPVTLGVSRKGFLLSEMQAYIQELKNRRNNAEVV